MSKDKNELFTRRTSKKQGIRDKAGFYRRLKYKISASQKLPYRKNMRKERFERLNASRREKDWNEIKMKFIRGKNPIPEDYIPIAITPKGLIICIHENTDGSVHPDLAKVMFPDYQNPLVKAIASSYTLVAPIGDAVILSYVSDHLSEEQTKKQQAAKFKIEERFEGKEIKEDTISEELLARLEPEIKIEAKCH